MLSFLLNPCLCSQIDAGFVHPKEAFSAVSPTPDQLREEAAIAALVEQHRFNPRTGNCACGWEPASDRGAERLHAKHVERVIGRR